MNDYLSTLAERATQRSPDFRPAPAPWFASEPAAVGGAAFELPLGRDVVAETDSRREFSDASKAIRPVDEFSSPAPRPRLDQSNEPRNAEMTFEVDAAIAAPTVPLVDRSSSGLRQVAVDQTCFSPQTRPVQPAAMPRAGEREAASVSVLPTEQALQQPRSTAAAIQQPWVGMNRFDQQPNRPSGKEPPAARSPAAPRPDSGFADAVSLPQPSNSVRELVVHERIVETVNASAAAPAPLPAATPRDGLVSRESLSRPKFTEIVPRPQFVAPLVAPAPVAVTPQPVAPASETVVHVTIGRVEVRAHVAGSQRRTALAASTPSVSSLDDYLHRRRSARQS